jgi:hypothetical protein
VIVAVAQQLERTQRALAAIPGAAEKAMASALNRAAIAGRQRAVEAIVERYAAKTSDVRGMIQLQTASPKNLSAVIHARSKALSLGYFPHAPKRPGTGGTGKPVLRAEVKRGAQKDVPGAFVAELNSGRRIMIRTGQKTASGKSAMRSLYTVPLAVMLGVENVRVEVEARAVEVLDQRLGHEIDRALTGSR